MGMLEEAKADLVKAHTIDRKSKAVKEELANINKALVDSKKKMKKAAIGGLLNKVKSNGK